MLVAMAFLCFVAGVLGFLFIVIGRPRHAVAARQDVRSKDRGVACLKGDGFETKGGKEDAA